MLSPRFQEGISLRDQGTIDLDLPGGDAQALEFICNFTHVRPERLPDTLPATQLLLSALTCDKYGFAAAVKHSAGTSRGR